MRLTTVFSDSFLDGFTFAGFLTRLRQPGEATQMFASTPLKSDADWQPLIFEPSPFQFGGVEVAGNLRNVPESALRNIIDLLRREDEYRKSSRKIPEKAEYGSSR